LSKLFSVLVASYMQKRMPMESSTNNHFLIHLVFAIQRTYDKDIQEPYTFFE
jgi:hypothetical protein